MTDNRKIHHLDSSTEDDARGGTYEYTWLTCRDPERWNEGDALADPYTTEPIRRRFRYSRDWTLVTCKLCLRRR